MGRLLGIHSTKEIEADLMTISKIQIACTNVKNGLKFGFKRLKRALIN